jgi:hypothetical protein
MLVFWREEKRVQREPATRSNSQCWAETGAMSAETGAASGGSDALLLWGAKLVV